MRTQDLMAAQTPGGFNPQRARRRFFAMAAVLLALLGAAAFALYLWVAPRDGFGRVAPMWIGNLCGSMLLLWAALLLCFAVPRGADARWRRRAAWLWMLLSPVAMVPLVEWLHDGPAMFASTGALISLLIYACMGWALFLLLGRSRPAQIAVAVLWWGLGLLSAVKTIYRGTPLVPWDIYALRTTVDVAGGYALPINARMVCTLLGLALYCAVCIRYPIRLRRRRGMRLTAAFAALCALGALCWAMVDAAAPIYINISTDNWYLPSVYKKEGFATALISNCKQLFIDRPAEYSLARVREELTGAEPVAPPAVMPERPVNIIIVMNESFADLQSVVPFETNRPLVDNLHALYGQSLHGTLSVSVYGGGTSTTEFEALTGNSAVFLPTESSAYVQYIQPALNNGYSIARQLRGLGYRTLAVHPADARNWSRDQAYPQLGFDEFLSLEDMPGKDAPENTLRDLYSDRALYDVLLGQLREKPAGEPLFLHCVTMQDHGYYDKTPTPGVEPRAYRTDGEPNAELDNYLTLLGISDAALGEFVRQLNALEEPTLLLFFGDHQPTVSRALVEDVRGEDWFEAGDAGRRMALYRTPFFIWSNRGLPAADLGEISPQYLGGLLMQVGGLPLSGYQRFLSALRAEWPTFTLQGAVDAQGNIRLVDEAMAESQALRTYEAAQYNLLFDVWRKMGKLFE